MLKTKIAKKIAEAETTSKPKKGEFLKHLNISDETKSILKKKMIEQQRKANE